MWSKSNWCNEMKYLHEMSKMKCSFSNRFNVKKDINVSILVEVGSGFGIVMWCEVKTTERNRIHYTPRWKRKMI